MMARGGVYIGEFTTYSLCCFRGDVSTTILTVIYCMCMYLCIKRVVSPHSIVCIDLVQGTDVQNVCK